MKKIYVFIFYLVFKFFIKIGKKDIPERKAIVVLSLWDFFYLLIPYAIIRYVTGEDIWMPQVVIAIIIIVIFLLHFFLLIYNNRYLRIYRQYEAQQEFTNKYGAPIIITYLLFPILMPLLFTFTIWR
jgi:hypothetical protein